MRKNLEIIFNLNKRFKNLYFERSLCFRKASFKINFCRVSCTDFEKLVIKKSFSIIGLFQRAFI